jgi:signal transduction histidine kinase
MTSMTDEELHEDSLRLLGRMAAGVVHDLNNILTVMRVALDLDDKARLREGIESAARLTQNLLEYARGSKPDPMPIDLPALVQRVLGLVGRVITPEVLVILDKPPVVPLVRGVEAELEQMLLNLVINACDAMSSGGELRIRLRVPGPSAVIIEVMDTGQGFVCEDTPTSPSGRSTKPGRGGGRGLGLRIVRAVVERHHAVLKIATREGGGTAISVILEPWTSTPRSD